jgi:membrane protein required for colicin V production
MIPAFNWFDVILALILLSSGIAGLRTGFARVVVGLIASVFGFLAAFWCYRLVSVNLQPWVSRPALADALGFFLVFIGVLILGSIIGAILSKLLKWVGLSWFNHLLGGVAGLARGILVIAVAVSAIVAFSPSPPPGFLANSRLLPYALQASSWLAATAPRELKDAFDAQMKNLRHSWTGEPNSDTHEI